MRGTMSARTAGAYLQEVREQRKLSRATVAKALQTSESQIERLDYGTTRVNGELLLAYARYIGANMRRLVALILDDPPPDDDSVWDVFDRLSPAQQRAVIEIIRQMGADE